MRKKTVRKGCAVLAVMLSFALLAGCAKEPDRNVVIGDQGTSTDSTESSKNTGEKFEFSYNNVKITPNDLMEPLVSAIGAEYSYYESPSCAYIGMDKCYVYEGFSIYTYPDDSGVDHVLQIVLTDDSIKTPEGLMLGETAERVIEIYGEDYTESDGSYAYTRGNTKLMIIMKEGRVYSIQYYYMESI